MIHLFDGCKNEKEKQEVLSRRFRKVFSTEDGKACLTVILEDLHFFDICATTDAQALKNYATFLIKNRLGISNTLDITEAILTTMNEA